MNSVFTYMNILKLTLKITILTFFFFSLGCGPLYFTKESEKHRAYRLKGYEYCHLVSCGPLAISQALSHFGINKKPIQIGIEIQDSDHTHYREIMGIISHEFTKITCPLELKKYLRKNNFVIKKINFKNLKKTDVAIILVKGFSDLEDWHWMCWPNSSEKEINNFFNDHTKIVSTYILTKNKI